MCEVDMDQAAVWLETPRKGRRPHRCSVCRGEIARGVVHIEIESLGEGGWWRHRVHEACLEFAQRWQLDVCEQEGWTTAPESAPCWAILEHIDAGDIDAAWGIAVWRAWMRQDVAELRDLFGGLKAQRLAREAEARRLADARWRVLQSARLAYEPRPQWD